MNTYRRTLRNNFTEVTKFKTLLKENYIVALDSLIIYIYTKKNVERRFEHDVESSYGVQTNENIRHS